MPAKIGLFAAAAKPHARVLAVALLEVVDFAATVGLGKLGAADYGAVIRVGRVAVTGVDPLHHVADHVIEPFVVPLAVRKRFHVCQIPEAILLVAVAIFLVRRVRELVGVRPTASQVPLALHYVGSVWSLVDSGVGALQSAAADGAAQALVGPRAVRSSVAKVDVYRGPVGVSVHFAGGERLVPCAAGALPG